MAKVLEKRIPLNCWGRDDPSPYYEIWPYRPLIDDEGDWAWVRAAGTVVRMTWTEFTHSPYAATPRKEVAFLRYYMTPDEIVALDMLEDGEYGLIATIPGLYVVEE